MYSVKAPAWEAYGMCLKEPEIATTCDGRELIKWHRKTRRHMPRALFIRRQTYRTCPVVLCVSRAVLSVVLGAWSVRFVGWADWVDCRCFFSFVFLGVARRLELSPCNTDCRKREHTEIVAHALLAECFVPMACTAACNVSVASHPRRPPVLVYIITQKENVMTSIAVSE